jgi:glycosyltransferase involved in cell wall biosynthesis
MISVAIVSNQVGKTPNDISYSFVFDEAYRLAGRGMNVHVVRATRDGDSFSFGMHFHDLKKKVDVRAMKSMSKDFCTYPRTSLLRRPTTLYWENLYAAKVSEVIEKFSIDLIHAHFAYPEGFVGLLARKRTGKPLVVTIHGYDILVEPSVGYGARINKRIDAVIGRVLNCADVVVAASQATFNEARKIVNEVNKVVLISNGIDTERFRPNLNCGGLKRKLGIEGFTVVFTLRTHEPRYGLEYLIRAAALVAKERENVVFVIGGDGWLRSHHEQLATKLNVRERMLFTGKIPQSEAPYYYAMSDIVVVPSLQEGFGLVVSEAMACEKPVIGTKVGGIPDQLTDGYNGFLVQPRSPEEIAKRILFLIDHPEESRRMGVNGRRTVREKFDIERRIDKILLLYRKLYEKGLWRARREQSIEQK